MIIRGNRRHTSRPPRRSRPSMRPRMIIRGNRRHTSRPPRRSRPSMRPRMIIRGNSAVAATCVKTGASFNEAADDHPRKLSCPQAGNPAPQPFNEAADDHPRKHELRFPIQRIHFPSMRPRMIIRGNNSQRLHPHWRTQTFNEAADDHPRKPATLAVQNLNYGFLQ